MSRRKPAPQDVKVQLNASIPLRLKDRLDEEAAGRKPHSVSALVSEILLNHFGMVGDA